LDNGQHFNIQAVTYDDATQKFLMVDFESGDIEDMAKAKTEDIQKFYTLAIDSIQQVNKEMELVKQVQDFLNEKGLGSNINLTGDIINSMQNIQKGDPQRLTQLMMESDTKDVMLPWGDHIRLNENGSLMLHGNNEDATPKIMPFSNLSESQQEVFARHAINTLEVNANLMEYSSIKSQLANLMEKYGFNTVPVNNIPLHIDKGEESYDLTATALNMSFDADHNPVFSIKEANRLTYDIEYAVAKDQIALFKDAISPLRTINDYEFDLALTKGQMSVENVLENQLIKHLQNNPDGYVELGNGDRATLDVQMTPAYDMVDFNLKDKDGKPVEMADLPQNERVTMLADFVWAAATSNLDRTKNQVIELLNQQHTDTVKLDNEVKAYGYDPAHFPGTNRSSMVELSTDKDGNVFAFDTVHNIFSLENMRYSDQMHLLSEARSSLENAISRSQQATAAKVPEDLQSAGQRTRDLQSPTQATDQTVSPQAMTAQAPADLQSAGQRAGDLQSPFSVSHGSAMANPKLDISESPNPDISSKNQLTSPQATVSPSPSDQKAQNFDEYYNNALAAARDHIENTFPNSWVSLSDPTKHDDSLSVIIDGKDTHLTPMVIPMDEDAPQRFVFFDQNSEDNKEALEMARKYNELHPDKLIVGEDAYAFFDIKDALDFQRQVQLIPEVQKLNNLQQQAENALPFANPLWQRDNNEQIEGAKLLLYGNDSGIRAEYLQPAPYEGQKSELGFAVGNGINTHNIDSLTEIYARQHPDQPMVNNGGDDQTVKFIDISHAMQFQSFVHQLVAAEPKLSQAQQQNISDIKERYPDTLVLNRNGDNYEAYGKDAQRLSSLLDLPVKYDQGFAVIKLNAKELETALPEIIVKGQHVTVVDDKELSIRTQAKVMNEIGSQLIDTLGEGHHSLIGHPPTDQLPGFHLATKGKLGYMNITSIDLSKEKVPTVSLNSEDNKTTMSLLLLPLDQQQNLLQYAKALNSYQSLQTSISDHLAQTPNQTPNQTTATPSPNDQARADLQSDRNREGDLQSPNTNQKANTSDAKVSTDVKDPIVLKDPKDPTTRIDPLKHIRESMRDTGLIALPVNFSHDDRRFMDIDGIVRAPYFDFSDKNTHRPETVIAPLSVEYQRATDSLLLHGQNINGDYLTLPLDEIAARRSKNYAYEVLAEQLQPTLEKAMEHAQITQYLADESLENNRASKTFIKDITHSLNHNDKGNLTTIGDYNADTKQLHVIKHNQSEHTTNDTWMDPMKLAEMISNKELVPVRKEDLVQPTLTYPTLEEVTAKRMEEAMSDQTKLQSKYLNTVFEYDSEKAVIVGANQNSPREWNPTGVELRAISETGANFSIVPDSPDNSFQQTGSKIDGIIMEIEKRGFIDRDKAAPTYLMDPISYSRDNDRSYGPDQIRYDGLMVDFGQNHFYFQQLLSGPEAGKYYASYEIENLDHSTKIKVVDMDIDMAFDRMWHALSDYDLRRDQSHSLNRTEEQISNIVKTQPLQMVDLERNLHNIPTGDREMAVDYNNPKMDVSMLEMNKEGKVILHGMDGPAPLDSLDETARFEVVRRIANDFRDQQLDISYMKNRLVEIGQEFTKSIVMMNAYPESDSSIIELQKPKTVETEEGKKMSVQAVLLDPHALTMDEKIKLFKDWNGAYNYQNDRNPEFVTAKSVNITDLRPILNEALDKAEKFLSSFTNNMSNKNSESMKPEEQKPQQEQPKADQQQKNDNRQQAAEQIRAAIGDDRKVKLNDNERISLETKKGTTINVDSVTVGKNDNISVNGEVEGKRQNIQAARLTDDSLSKLATHLDDLRSNKQAVAVEKPAEQKVSQQTTAAPAPADQTAKAEQKADAKVDQKPSQQATTAPSQAQTADQKADQPKERKVDPIEIKPDSKVQVNVVPNKALDHVYDIQLYVDGQKQGRGHHLSIEDRKAFFEQKTPEEKTAFAASVLPKYFEKELAGQKLPDNIERYHPETKQSQANEQKADQKATKEQTAKTDQKADQPKERKVDTIEIKPDSKVQVNVIPNKALDHVYDIQLYVDGQKQGRGHHLSIEDRKAFFDKKTPEEKTAFAASVLPKYFEKE
ncbi:MAG: hypothetical protein IJK36_01320, partial [Bacteroidales bacterium]|nr:hypothetical protein [Bacteroidales bacterium]